MPEPKALPSGATAAPEISTEEIEKTIARCESILKPPRCRLPTGGRDRVPTPQVGSSILDAIGTFSTSSELVEGKPRHIEGKPRHIEGKPRHIEGKLVRRAPTKARREANRRNAGRSTGPRSERGKAASSANAVKHGAFARPVLTQGFLARDGVLRSALADESADEFRAFLDRFNEALAPRDAMDAMLVEKMALALWRYRRLRRFERSKVDWEISFKERCVAKDGHPEARKPGMAESRAERRLLPDEETLQKILRYEAALEREWMRCYALLEQRRQQRENENPPPLHSILHMG